MRLPTPVCSGGYARFFRLSLCHETLEAVFKLNFSLLYHQKIDFRMFDDMMPWEKDTYLGMLINKVEEENEKAKLKAQERKAAARSNAARTVRNRNRRK